MTPEQEEAVRRALASEPAPGPMPRELADRLDAALSALASERSASAVAEQRAASPVTSPSGPSRLSGPSRPSGPSGARRRRWPGLLVAAASVAVLGVGVGIVAQDMSGSESADSATGTAATDESFREGGAGGDAGSGAGGADDNGPPETAPEDLPREEQAEALGGAGLLLSVRERPARLRSDSLVTDLDRVLDSRTAAVSTRRGELTPPIEDTRSTVATAARLVTDCDLPDTGRGDLLAAVRLDGERGTLVARKESGGTRVAEVYACAAPTRLLASIDLDAR